MAVSSASVPADIEAYVDEAAGYLLLMCLLLMYIRKRGLLLSQAATPCEASSDKTVLDAMKKPAAPDPTLLTNQITDDYKKGITERRNGTWVSNC